jgi:hypothetical protein
VKGHRPDVADVFRSYGAAFLERYSGATSAQQRRVLKDLSICRTAALGGHKKKCERCGHEQIAYNSCRNRHCPKCQAAARADWLAARQQELLEVPYFHVVFTLPDKLGPLALQNQRLLYGLLFRAVSETLLTIARDPKHLGAHIGFLVVLHTWGQNLHLHPHLHCVVPAGGLSPDGEHWVAGRDHFFLPVGVLSRLFRGKFLHYLQEAFDQGQLGFHGALQKLAGTGAWKAWLRPLRSKDWVVYAKPPFGGPQQVLKYLARYTHRVALSNQRLLSLDGGRVTFRWKDYAQGKRQGTMSLDPVEFIRRFLLHTLPTGFVHIRYYGFLAHTQRKQKLALLRQLLGTRPTPPLSSPQRPSEGSPARGEDDQPELCPLCKQGRLWWVETIPPTPPSGWSGWCADTS